LLGFGGAGEEVALDTAEGDHERSAGGARVNGVHVYESLRGISSSSSGSESDVVREMDGIGAQLDSGDDGADVLSLSFPLRGGAAPCEDRELPHGCESRKRRGFGWTTNCWRELNTGEVGAKAPRASEVLGTARDAGVGGRDERQDEADDCVVAADCVLFCRLTGGREAWN
jgi:hypothetical protein